MLAMEMEKVAKIDKNFQVTEKVILFKLQRKLYYGLFVRVSSITIHDNKIYLLVYSRYSEYNKTVDVYNLSGKKILWVLLPSSLLLIVM